MVTFLFFLLLFLGFVDVFSILIGQGIDMLGFFQGCSVIVLLLDFMRFLLEQRCQLGT